MTSINPLANWPKTVVTLFTKGVIITIRILAQLVIAIIIDIISTILVGQGILSLIAQELPTYIQRGI